MHNRRWCFWLCRSHLCGLRRDRGSGCCSVRSGLIRGLINRLLVNGWCLRCHFWLYFWRGLRCHFWRWLGHRFWRDLFRGAGHRRFAHLWFNRGVRHGRLFSCRLGLGCWGSLSCSLFRCLRRLISCCRVSNRLIRRRLISRSLIRCCLVRDRLIGCGLIGSTLYRRVSRRVSHAFLNGRSLRISSSRLRQSQFFTASLCRLCHRIRTANWTRCRISLRRIAACLGQTINHGPRQSVSTINGLTVGSHAGKGCFWRLGKGRCCQRQAQNERGRGLE